MKSPFSAQRNFRLLVIILLLSAISVPAQSMFRKIMDFDGDGRADFAVARARGSNLSWHVWQSTDGYKVQKWGLTNDILVAGDYDGDGKYDLAIYRPNFSTTTFIGQYSFYIMQSRTNTLDAVTFQDYSFYFDAPTNQDYDGDGRMDPGTYYGEYGSTLRGQFRLSLSGIFPLTLPSGNGLQRMGDMDGDGRADLAFLNVYTKILTLKNIDGSNPRTADLSFISTGWIVPADFDGDGKGDITFFRSSDGVWIWMRSSDGVMQTTHWGSYGDQPVPADYDGDGKTDLAIWRPGTSQAYYWIKKSSGGISVFAWGLSTDKLVTY